MKYKLKVEKCVIRYLKKLGKSQSNYFTRKIDKLKENKKGYRLLDVYRNIELWELRCSSHRIYYTVENKFIIIENIEYEGNISVSKAGTKNRQIEIIKKMKKDIRNRNI